MLFNNLNQYSISKSKNTVYFNPWAENPLPDFLKRFPHASVIENSITMFEGISFAQLLKDGVMQKAQ
jgi:hypothetical protein